jgi:hypothetical protein
MPYGDHQWHYLNPKKIKKRNKLGGSKQIMKVKTKYKVKMNYKIKMDYEEESQGWKKNVEKERTLVIFLIKY